jgi:hypothetical protein
MSFENLFFLKKNFEYKKKMFMQYIITPAAVDYIIFNSSSLAVILYGELLLKEFLVLKDTNKRKKNPFMNLITKCVKRVRSVQALMNEQKQ